MDCPKHSQGPMMGEKPSNKFIVISKEICIMHTKIKAAPHDITSGKQFSQAYKEWISQQYKENEVICLCVVNSC